MKERPKALLARHEVPEVIARWWHPVTLVGFIRATPPCSTVEAWYGVIKTGEIWVMWDGVWQRCNPELRLEDLEAV